jgi:starvation-inducible DNA-binding protein
MRKNPMVNIAKAKQEQKASLKTPNSLGDDARRDISAELNALLADVFQIFATIDPIAERVRKVGGTTLRSTGHITRLQRLSDNDADFVTPADMLAELREDNARLASFMRETHALCDNYHDVATASVLETWIDEAERRVWFLFESGRS